MDKIKIEIRQIKKGDEKTLSRLIDSMLEEGAFIYNAILEIKGHEKSWTEAALKKVEAKKASYLFAFTNQIPVAMARLEKRTGRHSHVADFGIRVNHGYRRKGIGKALLRETFKEARRIGVKRTTLDTYDVNKAARALYGQMGFVEYGFLPKSVKINNRYVGEVFLYKDIK